MGEPFTWDLNHESGQSLQRGEGGEPTGGRIGYQALLLCSPVRISCSEKGRRARIQPGKALESHFSSVSRGLPQPQSPLLSLCLTSGSNPFWLQSLYLSVPVCAGLALPHPISFCFSRYSSPLSASCFPVFPHPFFLSISPCVSPGFCLAFDLAAFLSAIQGLSLSLPVSLLFLPFLLYLLLCLLLHPTSAISSNSPGTEKVLGRGESDPAALAGRLEDERAGQVDKRKVWAGEGKV